MRTPNLILLFLVAGGLPAAAASSVQRIFDDTRDPWYGYPYGGTTSGGLERNGGGKVEAFHGDDREYSGWTIGFDTLHLQDLRRKGGITFQIRGKQGGEKVLAGLLDDETDGKDRKVQVQVDLSAYATLTKEWQRVTLPFPDFSDRGRWWNPNVRAEIEAPFDWNRVVEFRLASNQGANAKKTDSDHRFTVEIRDIAILDSADFFDRDAWWKAFRSDAPERDVFMAGEPAFRAGLLLEHGLPGDSIAATWPEVAGHGAVLELRYRFQAWVCAVFPLDGKTRAPRDWSRHRGLSLDVFSTRASSAIRLGVVDSSRESWVALARLKKGWNRIVVPFRDFERDPWWQPDDVVPNRRFDLGDVRSFSVTPMEGALPGSLQLGRVALTNENPATETVAVVRPAILHDQLGYLPAGGKRFLVSGMARQQDWALLDSTRKTVLQGRLSPLGVWDASGDTLAQGDFSRWTRPGRYRLAVGDSVSSEFVIADTVFRGLSRNAVRAYWFQRCGTSMPESLAGIWARRAGHPDTGLAVEEVPGFRGRWNAPGGWYDAGDYGKYVVNAGIALGNLLSLQETWPDAFPDGSLSIPESGNKVGDLLDEMRWELSWIARMQDKDGGVFFKVGAKNWDGSILPEHSTQPRFVFGKSTSSTLDAAAVFAQASRVWAKVDPVFARDCRARAERAWNWARLHPDVPYPKNEGGTGAYVDGPLADERFWAASELWIATGRKEYRDALLRIAPTVPVKSTAWWQDVGNLGWSTLARLGGDDALARDARRGILEQADTLLARLEGNAGRVLGESFVWGSNDIQMGCAITLAQAYRIDPKPAYRDGALEALDYVLGRNVLGESFVTGTGSRSPLHIHHRLLRGEALAPFPGLLVGGPNGGREDDVTRDVEGVRWRGELPARSWRDDERSYATNEICINWNSSLAWMAFWADRLGR